jgi:hypothetical protein
MYTSILLLFVLFLGVNVFKSKDEVAVDELPKPLFLRTYLLIYISWFFLGCLFAFIEYTVNKELENKAHDFVFNLYPDNNFWIGTSIIFGFAVALVVCFGGMEIILKNRAGSFWLTYNKRYPFNAKIFLKILLFLLTIVGISISQLGHRAFFKVYEDKIEISRLFELEKNEFSMDEIIELNHLQLYLAPSGEKVNKPHYEILFNDSSSWNTLVDMRLPSKKDSMYFEYISTQSGILIQIKN